MKPHTKDSATRLTIAVASDDASLSSDQPITVPPSSDHGLEHEEPPAAASSDHSSERATAHAFHRASTLKRPDKARVLSARRAASELFDARQHHVLARDTQRLKLRQERICRIVVNLAEDE